jgi:hypothetical protein
MMKTSGATVLIAAVLALVVTGIWVWGEMRRSRGRRRFQSWSGFASDVRTGPRRIRVAAAVALALALFCGALAGTSGLEPQCSLSTTKIRVPI